MSDFTGPIPIAPSVADKDLSACRYDLRRYDTCCPRALVDLEASIGKRTLARTVGVRPNAPPASRIDKTVGSDCERVKS